MSSSRMVLNALQQQARRLQVARKLPETGPIPLDLVREVQQAFEVFLSTSGETVKQVSRRMGRGFSASTLSTWRNFSGDVQSYKGDLDGHTRAVNRVIEVYAQQLTAPKGPAWVETEVAKQIITAIKQTVRLQSMAMVTSDSGRGKTITFEAAAKVFPGTIYQRVRRGGHTASGLARELKRSLGIKGASSTLDVQHAVEDQLKDSGRLIIVDELHQARRDAVELLRDIHDVTGCPMVLGGTRQARDAVSDEALWFGQLASRIAIQLDINDHIRGRDGKPKRPLHTIDELRELFASDEVRFTADGMATLANLANLEGYGGLRLCKQVVVIAATVARAPIDANLLMRVLRELHGRLRVQDVIEPAMRRQEVKVA